MNGAHLLGFLGATFALFAVITIWGGIFTRRQPHWTERAVLDRRVRSLGYLVALNGIVVILLVAVWLVVIVARARL